MPRLTEDERTAVMDNFTGHSEQVVAAHPTFEIAPGFGRPQLLSLFDDYREQRDAINTTVEVDLPAKRDARTALFGTSALDVNGVWRLLTLYKSQVRLALRPNHPLNASVPNLGNPSPKNYDNILRRFCEHWKLVNAALPPANPLVLGTLSQSVLETKRAEIEALVREVDEIEQTQLRTLRAAREEIFGDVNVALRSPTSIVTRLEQYRGDIELNYPDSPLASSLPRIFPESKGPIPHFPFNFAPAGSDANVWFLPPDEVDASVVFLKEGAYEQTQPMPTSAPFRVTFSDITIVDGLDEVELRDEDGRVVAHGRFDGALPNVI